MQRETRMQIERHTGKQANRERGERLCCVHGVGQSVAWHALPTARNSAFPQLALQILQWGTVDAEIEVLSAEKSGL